MTAKGGGALSNLYYRNKLTKALISAGRLSQNLDTASSIFSSVALVSKYLSNSLINSLQISHSNGFAFNKKIELKQ